MRIIHNLLLFLFVYLGFSFNNCFAQTPIPALEYGYDDAGNRISRQIVVLENKTMLIQDSAQNPQMDSAAMAANINQMNDSGNSEVVLNQYIDNIGSQFIKVYPNPTRGLLTFQISPFPEGEKVEIRVFDQQNRLLFTLPCSSEYNVVDLSDYATGVYLMCVAVENKMSNWKIIKE